MTEYFIRNCPQWVIVEQGIEWAFPAVEELHCRKQVNRGNLRSWPKTLFARYAICRKNDASAKSIAYCARAPTTRVFAKMASITARPAARRAICRHSFEELGNWVIW